MGLVAVHMVAFRVGNQPGMLAAGVSGQPKPDIGCGKLVFCVDVRSDGACSSSGPWSSVTRHASYMAATIPRAGGVPAIAKI